ncbi:MAG TPA: hypothetical protein VK796_04645 [Cytophaga sp.]|nr:hypothetical protein [Cytophaga sp.]
MKRLYSFLILIFIFCRIADAQQWEQLGKSSYKLKGGPIRAIYADTNGNVYAGIGAVREDITKGKFFKCSNTKASELKSFPYYNQNMVIEYILEGNNSKLYIAGYYFQRVSQTDSHHELRSFIVEYNGKTWKNLLKDEPGYISSICIDNSGNIYATGLYITKDPNDCVAKWNGKTWAPVMIDKETPFFVGLSPHLCTGPDGTLYVADDPKGHPGWNVIKWNGKEKTILGDSTHSLNANGKIHSICCDKNGHVYVAGNFTNKHHNNYVAVWDGKNWSELGGENTLQANKQINILCTDNSGNLYATGHFTNKNKKLYIAHWDGKNWSELGGTNALHINDFIISICIDVHGNVYTAGYFSSSKRNRYIAVYRK